MNLHEFAEDMKNRIQGILGEDAVVQTTTVKKNNGVVMEGISIRDNIQVKVAPTIYMNSFYEDVESGMDIGEVENEILRIYSKSKNSPYSIDGSNFTNWEWVKERLIFNLVNAEMNEELLNEAPNRREMDLAMIYKIVLDSNDGGMATVTIRNNLMKQLDVSEDDLYMTAMQNTPKLLPAQVVTMGNMLGMLGAPVDVSAEEMPMYIVTNESKMDGASAIMYANVLKELSDKIGDDLIIIPSSIHEVIALPSRTADAIAIKAMVYEVNETQVDKTERLSYNVYRYSNGKGITIAA